MKKVKNTFLAALTVLMLLVLTTGCYMQKRVHNPGYYKEWVFLKTKPKKKFNIERENNAFIFGTAETSDHRLYN